MVVRYLNKNSTVPLYRQLASHLASQILNGGYQAGDRLPSERELSEQFNVSRITARQAIATLLDDGIIFTEQGRGTFVAEPLMRRLRGLTSFTEDMAARGYKPTSRVLVNELVTVSEELQNTLKLGPQDQVFHLVRLRMADGKPVAIQDSYVSCKLCPGVELEDFTNRSLFALLREKYFVYPTWTEVDIEALPASEEEARWLRIKTGEPVLVVKGKTFTDSFEVIEKVCTIYRGKGLVLYIGRQRLGTSN
jgi:GntR family transcriptional regulator